MREAVRMAACPCGEPSPAGYPPCTFEKPCGYGKDKPPWRWEPWTHTTNEDTMTDLTNVVLEEDVIAALRLAQEACVDAERFGRVAEIILEAATPTPDDNRGGVELLIRLSQSGVLRFEVDCNG